jgi:hypothetical protein
MPFELPERKSNMRRFVFASVVFGVHGLVSFASVPVNLALAHEEHQMECDETNINAMNADIQAMLDGEAKTTAMTEMKMAEEMMANDDMKACKTHMHNAMEALEK